MKPEIKQKWVDALRSGEYQQVQGVLRTNYGFCCLGVLCDLAVKDGVELQVKEDTTLNRYSYDREMSLLPKTVCEWAGLTEKNPFVNLNNGTEHKTLSAENDNGKTFGYIAALIENGVVK